MIVEGQVHGGLAQGIAQALFEEAVYDDNGTLVTGIVRGLPGAVCGRTLVDFVTDRTESSGAVSNELGAKGSVRPWHASLPRRPSSMASSTRCGRFGCDRHRDAMYADAGLEGDSGGEAADRDIGQRANSAARGGRSQTPRSGDAEGGQALVPAAFDYKAPTSFDEALQLLAGWRRRCQDHRWRPEPAASAEAAARGTSSC